MSLANYEPVTFRAGLNRVEFSGTRVEIPDGLPLYYMIPVGNIEQIKAESLNQVVRSGLNPALLLGNVHNVQLYYDTGGYMTIPEKRAVAEIGLKGPGGTEDNPTIQLPQDIQKRIAGYTTPMGVHFPGFGGKRKTKSNRKNKKRKTKRR